MLEKWWLGVSVHGRLGQTVSSSQVDSLAGTDPGRMTKFLSGGSGTVSLKQTSIYLCVCVFVYMSVLMPQGTGSPGTRVVGSSVITPVLGAKL